MHGKIFDLRLPLGYLFLILGGLLGIQGVAADPSSCARSLGINLDLIWGGILIVFGTACLVLAVRHRRAVHRARIGAGG